MATVHLEVGEADAWRVSQIRRITQSAKVSANRALTLIHNITVATDEQVGRHILAGTHFISLADLEGNSQV
jgi:hypothetical protein